MDSGSSSGARRLTGETSSLSWTADVETLRITSVDAAGDTLLGFPAEHWVNEPDFLARHLFPEDREAALALYRAAARSWTDREGVHRYLTIDGSVRPLRIRVRAAVRACQIQGVMVPVEEGGAGRSLELEQSNALLRAAFESTADGILIVGRNATIVDFNQKFGEMWGISDAVIAARDEHQALARVLGQLREPEGFLREVEALDASSGATRFDVFELRDGRIIERFSQPQYLGQEVVGRVWSFRDVTRQKRAERERDQLLIQEQAARSAAQEAQRRTSLLAEVGAMLSESLDYPRTLSRLGEFCVRELADWCIIDVIEDGTLRREGAAHVDPAKRPLLDELARRFPPSRGDAKPIGRVVSSGESLLVAEATDEVMKAHFQDPEHRALLRELGTRSGMIIPLITSGRVLGVLSLVSARTDRTYTPSDLELASELARRAALAIDHARVHQRALDAIGVREVFLMVASHELKTPITALNLRLQMLLRSVHRAEKSGDPPLHLNRDLEAANRQGEKLTALLEQLLDVSVLASGRFELIPERVDLVDVVREAIDGLRGELEQSGSRLTVESSKPAEGHWDRLRVNRIATNLLSNAIKYGQGKPIEVSIDVDGAQARLRVCDHGVGFTAKEGERLFSKFVRLESARRHGGLGLGLFIARQLAEAHGGEIRVEGRPGVGAVFELTLPLELPGS